MPIRFTCPHCGKTTEVDEQYAGQTGPCAQCGGTIAVPALPGGPPAHPQPAKRAGPTVIAVVAVLLVSLFGCGTMLLAILLPAVRAVSEAARRAQCQNNLKQIGLALHNYQTVYGCYPPAYIADKDGRPMHSWRVLILPFMDEQALYDEYRFDEPWDGPRNRALAARMPAVFRCPSDTACAPGETNYVVVVSSEGGAGPKTVFNGPRSAAASDIRDGPSNTILAVETTGTGIHWMEPRDLDLAEVPFVNDPNGPGMSSHHSGGAQALFCDGAVQFIASSCDGPTLRCLLLRDDGQPNLPRY